ncbi:histidine kinase osmosensor [Peltigera leucophlebia]|nr:histidine kinase osmosensor [Peltigera leucophlebia]
MRGTVFGVLKKLAVKANDKLISLTYQVDSSVPDYVIGDSFRLRHIILNLVGNAIKFTEHGGVELTIKQAPDIDCRDGEYAFQFSVSDTGVGIQKDKLGLIFDTFQQADASTTGKFARSGLGLLVSRKFVNQMGGMLWATSEYGHGSHFYFTCVVELARDDLAELGTRMDAYKDQRVFFIEKGQTGCAGELIDMLKQLELQPMLVDDEVHVSLLGRPNVAHNSLKKNGSTSYDTILVDCMETAVSLRNYDELRYIPIVLLAPVVSVNMKSALDLGIASCMTTPCKAIDLANGMIPALEGRQKLSISNHSKPFNILLAEDNEVNQRLAVKILEKYHQSVTVANNGLEALEAVMKRRYDVILMDIQMPVMNGFEATAKIREYEREGDLVRSPIIALSAHALSGDREKCVRAQMDEYLTKPLKQFQMMQTILKCATLGEKLLEHGKETRLSAKDDITDPLAGAALATSPSTPKATKSGKAVPKPEVTFKRQAIESRKEKDSPGIISVGQ